MKSPVFLVFLIGLAFRINAQDSSYRLSATPDSIATHRVIVDSAHRLLSWIAPQSQAYSRMLQLRWQFILDGIPSCPGPAPRSDYPMYYFYCAYRDQKMIPDTWMNDVGEKIPNWYESARLYYQFSGDERPLQLVEKMALYCIGYGTSPASFEWPLFPYTTTNAGDTVFRGFTDAKRFALHEVQIDHAADMGLAYYGLFLYSGNQTFRKAAIDVANALAVHAKTGTAHASVWPYRVLMNDGHITAPYGANWFPAYELLDRLSAAGEGRVQGYRAAMAKVRQFILQYPMRTGFWSDGHTDTDVRSDTYKSNMSASNATLYLLRHPEFDPDWKTDIPKLIGWTEKNFVDRCAPGEPSAQWGANLVGEQDEFLPKMDYQTSRYGAGCAAWYALSKESGFREKAFRSLNWATYCTDDKGMVFESPVSKGITSWWSDCYGEGPRMFYLAMAAVPEWAPEKENHILYSDVQLDSVTYREGRVSYFAPAKKGKEYIKLQFLPAVILLNGHPLPADKPGGSTFHSYSAGEASILVISRESGGTISISR